MAESRCFPSTEWPTSPETNGQRTFLSLPQVGRRGRHVHAHALLPTWIIIRLIKDRAVVIFLFQAPALLLLTLFFRKQPRSIDDSVSSIGKAFSFAMTSN
jgi:hypothetical protein